MSYYRISLHLQFKQGIATPLDLSDHYRLINRLIDRVPHLMEYNRYGFKVWLCGDSLRQLMRAIIAEDCYHSRLQMITNTLRQLDPEFNLLYDLDDHQYSTLTFEETTRC